MGQKSKNIGIDNKFLLLLNLYNFFIEVLIAGILIKTNKFFIIY